MGQNKNQIKIFLIVYRENQDVRKKNSASWKGSTFLQNLNLKP